MAQCHIIVITVGCMESIGHHRREKFVLVHMVFSFYLINHRKIVKITWMKNEVHLKLSVLIAVNPPPSNWNVKKNRNM